MKEQYFIPKGGKAPDDMVVVYPEGHPSRLKDSPGMVVFAPYGGGFFRTAPKTEFEAAFSQVSIVEFPLQPAQFSIDGGEQYPGFHTGEKWNGWAMPYFIKEVADQLHVEYLIEQDAYHAPFDKSEELEMFKGIDKLVDGQIIHLYPIGAGSWCWEVV
jgi:hypothetical protein